MSIKRVFTSLLLTLLLAGCLGVKFTYNNLDWVIPWYLDDYLVLDKGQDKNFDQQLDILWQWHRTEELPQYSALFHEIIADLDNQKVSHERLHYYTSQGDLFYTRIIHKSLEQGAPLIAQLSDQQITDLLDSIAEDDQDFKEYVAETDLQERIKERRTSVAKTFKKWLGPLSKTQKKRIRNWSKETETSLEYHMEYVTKTRKVFKATLEQRQDQQQTKRKLFKLASQPELLRSKAYNETIERNSQRFRQLLLDTVASLSKKQRTRLRNKMLNYAEDFSELSKKT